MNEGIRNPFPVVHPLTNKITGWKWLDETGAESTKTYPTQAAALRELMAYVHWLDHGPTVWQRLWWPIRYKLWPAMVRFWHDQGHATGKRL